MTNKIEKGNLIKHLAKNDCNFTIMNNEILFMNNPPVSLEILGAYWRLKSLPPDWHFTRNGFAQTCGCSKGKASKLLNQIEKINYFRKERKRAKNGQFDSYEYHFYETTNLDLLKETDDVTELENPTTKKPKTENPTTDNQASYKEYMNKESSNKKSKNIINKSETKVSDNSIKSKEVVNSTKGISRQEKKEQNIKKLTEMARKFTNNLELSESLDGFISLIARVDSRNLNEPTFRSNLRLLSKYQLAEQIEIVEKALRTNKPYLSKPYNSVKTINSVKSINPKISQTQSKRYIPNTITNKQKEDL